METISDSFGIRGSVESLIGGRNENQDSYGMAETRLGMLVVVCDGMGGGPAGKTASSIATQSIIDYVSGADVNQSPLSVLTDAVVSANEAILSAVSQNPALSGMGTTCVGVLISNRTAYIVHVGDSRCYQIRSGRVVFRTADHSYVGELVRRGTMSEEEARNSKYSNVITRAIGASPTVDPELDTVDFHPGDRFALMSDGIWGTMPEPQLVKFLSEPTDPANLVPTLARNIDTLGRDNGGGHDNLTLAIIDTPNKKSVNLNPTITPASTTIKATPNSSAPVQPAGATKAKKPTSTSPINTRTADKATNHKKSHAVSITIIIATALVICFIVFLYFQSLKENTPAEQNDGTASVELTTDNPNKAEENSQSSTPTEKPTTPQKAPKTQPNIQKAINAKSVPDAPTTREVASENANDVAPAQDNNKPENAHFTNAITALKKLIEYRPDPKWSNYKVETERRKMLKEIGRNIKMGIDVISDSNKKNSAQKIYDDYGSKIETLAKAFDKNTDKNINELVRKTTEDGNKIINSFIGRLEKLIKQ